MGRQRQLRAAWLRRTAAMLTVGSSLGLGACSGAHEPAHVPLAGHTRESIAPTTNVPALLGKSINGLRQRLGTSLPLPDDFRDPILNYSQSDRQIDSTAAFRTGGLLLVANYDARSGEVHDLLLLGHHEDSLMSRASLRSNATEYLVLPVFYTGSQSRLLGLRIVSTN